MRGRTALLAGALAVFVLAAAPLAGAKPGPKPGPGSGNSDAAKKCQKGGYKSLVGADGTTFRNVGACVSFAAHGGTFATGLVVPAGKKATLSNAQFGDQFPTPGAPTTFTNCPGDPLAYGYQLNLGANVQVATGGAGCQAVAGAVIGPFPTAVLLRIWLTDLHAPVTTFYSDGNHANVSGSNPWLVSIRDSVFGTNTTNPLVPPPGDGNLNVVVTVA